MKKVIQLMEHLSNNWKEYIKMDDTGLLKTFTSKNELKECIKPPNRDIIVENDEFIKKVGNIYMKGLERKDTHREELIKYMKEHAALYEENMQHLYELNEIIFSGIAGDLSKIEGLENIWMVYWYLELYFYHQNAERILRNELKQILYFLLVENGELNIIRKLKEKELPQEKRKVQIITSLFGMEEPKSYLTLEVKEILREIKIGNPEELDYLGWGDIFNIFERVDKEKKIIKTILKYFDPQLRNSIAHGKAYLDFEEDMTYVRYNDKRIDIGKFADKMIDLLHLQDILKIARIYGVAWYVHKRKRE